MGCGPAEERVLLTGLHAVADIYCECCKTTLGWKYVSHNLLAAQRLLCYGANRKLVTSIEQFSDAKRNDVLFGSKFHWFLKCFH